MLRITGTTIHLTRGDTGLIQLALTDENDNPYVPTEGDAIRFAMKKKMSDDEEVLARIDIPTDTLLLEIKPEDTSSLAYSKSKPYKYDIEITYASGRKDTFVEDADIYLMPEVV